MSALSLAGVCHELGKLYGAMKTNARRLTEQHAFREVPFILVLFIEFVFVR